ncbi:MAG: hypothetical protein IJS08_10210 [Victivallales bacterium]|nr:hypothetical protein [Victivallales bacterium]
MKQFYRKLFFLDEPAKGAFFGVTGILVLPWLIMQYIGATFVHASAIDIIFYGYIGLNVGWILLLKCWVLRDGSLDSLIPKDTFFLRRHFYGIAGVFMVLICIISATVTSNGFVVVPIALLFLFIDLTIVPNARFTEWLALFVLLLCGVLGFSMIVIYSIFPFYVIIDILSEYVSIVQYHEYPVLTPLCDALHISGAGWSWLAFVSYLFILSFYLLQGKVIARKAKVPMRSLFGKRVLCLLGLFLAFFVVGFVLAWRAEAGYHKTVGELEAYFGRPLEVKEVEKLFYDGKEPDTDFWKKLKEVSWIEKWRDVIFPIHDSPHYHFPLNKNLFWSVWDAEPYGKWRDFCLNNPGNATLNSLLDGVIPSPPREYAERKLLRMPWDFKDRMLLRNCSYQLLWQLRFSSEAHDTAEVMRIFERLDNICAFAKRDELSFFYQIESHHLMAIQYAIESGMMDDAWLDKQSEKLERLEQEVSELAKREMFRHAVIENSILQHLAHHLDVVKGEDYPRVGAELSRLRCFFPPIWWMTAYSSNVQARHFLDDPLAQNGEVKENRFWGWHDYGMRTMMKVPKKLLASIRCARGLLEVEKIKRQTGSYPLQMESLPLDPFTGKPLQYFIGPCEITADVVKLASPEECDDKLDYGCTCGCDCTNGCRCREKSTQTFVDMHCSTYTINAVQVSSQGPEADRESDDILFFIKTP